MISLIFRYWSNHENKYLTVDEMPIIGINDEHYHLSGWDNDKFEQYSNFDDCKGLKAFDGDIVLTDQFFDIRKNMVVYMIVKHNKYGFSLVDRNGVENSIECVSDYEIVGNINENNYLMDV